MVWSPLLRCKDEFYEWTKGYRVFIKFYLYLSLRLLRVSYLDTKGVMSDVFKFESF